MASRLTSQTKDKEFSSEIFREFYHALIFPRLIEEKMLLLLRQGKVSKWFSGIGQEAIAVGSTLALQDDEYILPLHRNLGVFTTRKVPLSRLLAQWQGTASGFTKGRDRSFHFGTNEYRIVGMISHLGPQLCVADGIALAHKLSKEKKVTMVFTGDGGTSEGDFHEALNVAAVWDLPVIFIIENNGYGLSTPISEQFRCEKLSDRARGYGMEGVTIDGNDLLEVYRTVSHFAQEIRKKPRPVLIECMTFRMRGHEEASGTKYVPKQLMAEWAKKDPILRFETFLDRDGRLAKKEREKLRAEIQSEIESAIEIAFSEPPVVPNDEVELNDVYLPFKQTVVLPKSDRNSERRFVDAISDGLAQGLEQHPKLVIMGQDIAEYGGVFKVTEGFVDRFGPERILNTPLCESAIVGAALGLSIKGYKSVVEMQFADFVTCGFNQIINNLAKIHYRWGQNADVVVRLPCGGGSGAGPFHSQTMEAWFTHTPGLKIVYPAFPYDAKGLLLAALEDPNPVLFFEHKALYRSIKQTVPDDYYTVEIGRAQTLQQGTDATIITYGLGVHWALEAVQALSNISFQVLDLRTLIPLDSDAIRAAVAATGKVMVLHEATLTGGFGAEIAAWIAEHCFELLDAPVMRCASLDTPIPFVTQLEQNFVAKARLAEMLGQLIDY